MKKAYIIAALVLLVVAVFVFKPELLGIGGESNIPTFTVLPTDGLEAYVTNIPCDKTQVCVDRALSEGTPLEDINTECQENNCVYFIEGIITEVSE